MQAIDGIFYVMVLIMSVVVHEFAHGYVAYLLGDNTARAQGRLTLNPIKHLDPFGSVILPLLLVLSNTGFIIGWARPVPFSPDNFKNVKKGTFLVAIAGIVANLAIALIFSLIIRFMPIDLGEQFYKIAATIVIMNLVLALFNLIPIPPLDGSKLLFSVLPHRLRYIENFLNQYAIFFLIFFIFFVWDKIAPIVLIAFSFLTGLNWGS